MSTQLKLEAEAIESAEIIETYYSAGDEPMYDIAGDNVILTFRQPFVGETGDGENLGDCVLYFIKDTCAVGGLYRPTHRLVAMSAGRWMQEYFVLEYDAASNQYVLFIYDSADDKLQRIFEFSSEVALERIAFSGERIYCWGMDRSNQFFAIMCADFQSHGYKDLLIEKTSDWQSAVCHNGEIFFGGRKAIYRQSFDMDAPQLLCKTAGAIADMAIVEGKLMYLGDLSGERRGIAEVSLEDGSEIRTIALERYGIYSRLVNYHEHVFIHQNAICYETETEESVALPCLSYLDKSGRVFPVAAVADADINSVHVDSKAVYWVETSPPLTMPSKTGKMFDRSEKQYTIRRIMLENIGAAEITDRERLVVAAPKSDKEDAFNVDYDKRWDAYQELFGPLEDQVGMLVNLRMNCPGMCITHSKPKNLPYPEMALTFGLAGAHAGTGFTTNLMKTTDNGDSVTYLSKVEKGTTLSCGKFSGYGFELVAASRVGGQWLPRLLTDMAHQQVSGEFDFFNTIIESGAVTAGPYLSHLGLMGEETNYLIAPAWGKMPKSIDVGHGKIMFFALINITATEMRFVEKRGPRALLEKLRAANVEPLIDPERKSCI